MKTSRKYLCYLEEEQNVNTQYKTTALFTLGVTSIGQKFWGIIA